MSLTVLSDGDVRGLLTSLSKNELAPVFAALSTAFQSYSIGGEGQYQCHRQGVTRPGGPTMLFMPATLPGGASVKVVGVPLSQPASSSGGQASQAKPISGAIMLFDSDGKAIGVLNAAELTAFRTSLGSILIYQHRARTEHIVVFGAGKQAQWHLRLALVLRGSDVRTVTIINRSAQRAQALVDRLRAMDREAGSATVENVEISILDGSSAGSQEYEDRLRHVVQQADVIFCTTPSNTPLFPAEWLTSEESRQKQRFISAIGSYKLDMQEIDPAFLRAVATPSNTPSNTPLPGLYHPKHEDPAAIGGVILVDSREGCALEAGELVKAQVPDENLLEAGELIHIQNTADQEAKRRLAAWLSNGTVVYKSVGMGIMDLAIGKVVLELAASPSVGTTVEQF